METLTYGHFREGTENLTYIRNFTFLSILVYNLCTAYITYIHNVVGT